MYGHSGSQSRRAVDSAKTKMPHQTSVCIEYQLLPGKSVLNLSFKFNLHQSELNMHLKERKREKVLFLCLTVKSEAVLSLCGEKNILTSLYFKGIVRAKSGHFFLKLRKVTHLYSDSCYIVFIKDRRMKDHENIQLHLIRFFFSLKMTLTCRR